MFEMGMKLKHDFVMEPCLMYGVSASLGRLSQPLILALDNGSV